MKKFVKPLIVLIVIVSVFLGYKYVFFDHEPFDDIRVWYVEKVYLTRSNDDRRVEVTDIPRFFDRLEDVELRCRTNEIRQENIVSGVKVSIYYKNGTSQIISVDNCHVWNDDKLFEADHEEAYYFLEYANKIIFNDAQLTGDYDKTRYNTVIGLYLQGLTQRQVREWVKGELIGKAMDEFTLKSLANQGWAPEQIYTITDEKRQELIQAMEDAVMPGGAARRLMYETMADEVLEKYRKGEITPDKIYSRAPADFVFPEYIDWSKYSFTLNEMGYYSVGIPSATDADYIMGISVDDIIFDDVMRETPVIHHVGFHHK